MSTSSMMKLVIVFICFAFVNVSVLARGKRHDENVFVVGHKKYDHKIFPHHGGHIQHPQIDPVYRHVPDRTQRQRNPLEKQQPRDGHSKHHNDLIDKRQHLSAVKQFKPEHLLGADKTDYVAAKHAQHNQPEVHHSRNSPDGIKAYRFHNAHDIPVHTMDKSKRFRNHARKHLKMHKHKKNGDRNEHFKNKKRGHKRGHEKHVMSNMENHALDRFAQNRRDHWRRGDRSKMHNKEKLPSNTLPEEKRKVKWAKKDMRNSPNNAHRHEQIDIPRHHKRRFNWCLKKRDCPLKLKPLCGSNGRTYNNRCQLRQAACKNGGFKSITIQHRGACKNKAGNL